MVKNDASEPPARKHARDAASFRVLRREVKKMRDLNGFQERAITLFDKNLRYLSSKGARDRLVPDGYYLALIRVVDLLSKVREHCSVVYPPSNNTGPPWRDYRSAVGRQCKKMCMLCSELDNLKDMKASLSLDFSRYRRLLTSLRDANQYPPAQAAPAATSPAAIAAAERLAAANRDHNQAGCGADGDSAEFEFVPLLDGEKLSDEADVLQLFLHNFKYPKNLIFHSLRDHVKAIDGHEETLTAMLAQAVDYVQNERYHTPDEKYRYVRAMPHLLLLIDGKTDAKGDAYNVFKKLPKDVLKAVQTTLRSFPVVPQYGDMPLRIEFALAHVPHYDAESMGKVRSQTNKQHQKTNSRA